MIYRRKTYLIDPQLLSDFNDHFNETLLPTQLKYGSRLVGRWVTKDINGVLEVFAIWEYDSFDNYEHIESQVKSDEEHVKRVQAWFDKIGREKLKSLIKGSIKDEFIEMTTPREKTILE
ncbi:NIPSNAP family protein [Paenibacillus sp. BC26]|uniref:NIPSNAP family protein n=1 Tax=Paenibacillus sp. BC26 TaxID=1881032 RepID=UPI0008F309AB|nr:NIPSNAP family protein [Paenibacillus sp. BC26]SFS76751.1 NIPSNAP protein [Paenibacillus sp. BC26]